MFLDEMTQVYVDKMATLGVLNESGIVVYFVNPMLPIQMDCIKKSFTN